MPDAARHLIDRVSRLMPRIKITELLTDVDDWTGFTDHFVHLKTDEPAKDRTLLLSTVLADGINLGLTRMADSSPDASYDRLSWLQAWHVRDETYAAALTALVNAQLANPFAALWGDGTMSSSDGQRFQTGDRGQGAGQINPRYGSAPGRLVHTHVSDRYAPFATRLINVGVRDSTYVLDGLLYHESDPRIEEHYTDTAGFTDHVFALMHLLGFRFAPRIRDLKDTRLYIERDAAEYPELRTMVGGSIDVRRIREHWNGILRLATSIRTGSVTASLMVRKISSYPRQNGLAVALRELGRLERSLFILDWLPERGPAPARAVGAEQGRGEERVGPGGVLQPARGDPGPELRAAALPGERPDADDRRDRALEHRVPGTGRRAPAERRRGDRRCAARLAVAAGLGTHQPDGGLRVAAELGHESQRIQILADRPGPAGSPSACFPPFPTAARGCAHRAIALGAWVVACSSKGCGSYRGACREKHPAGLACAAPDVLSRLAGRRLGADSTRSR